MRHVLPIAALLSALAFGPAQAADADHPTVIELFQSQGCNSCPPAIANVNALAGRPHVLALTFAVDYWDNLGWKDTFAKHKYTERQYAYSHSLGHDQVFTPQLIVNGHVDGVGTEPGEIEGLMRAAGSTALGARIDRDRLILDASGSPGNAEIWVAFYDPRTLEVAIGRGENAGHTIGHRNVVKDIVLAGHWNGGAESIDLPAAPEGLLRAVLVQKAGTGAILGALRG